MTAATTTVTPDAALEAIRRQDEALSLLYWLHVDRLSEAPDVEELARFMGATPVVADDLERLVAAGLVEALDHAGARRYRLSPAGMAEGKRRFEEDFTPALEDGVAGNSHEVMFGVCGPNAKCVKEGKHGECAEPELVYPPPATVP
jgi:hypothetical protein